MTEIAEFYDQFSDHQIDMGINHRHLSIQYQLENFGLNVNDSVLEVGCGIGTVSELILRYLNAKGNLLGIDISERSIAIAKGRLKKYKNSNFLVHDLAQDPLSGKYDVILLPDVIEHIPIEDHQLLFKNAEKLLKDDGFIFIHIPDPNYLESSIKKEKKGLQIIDQPIHTSMLARNISATGLYIHFLRSYSIYDSGCDYQSIVLRKIPDADSYETIVPKKEAIRRRLTRKLKYFLRGNK